MADRWFRVPNTHTTAGGNRPKYTERSGVVGFSGNHIGASPVWVVRIYGSASTLDGIAAEADATELTASEAASRFDNAGVSWLPDSGWDATSVNNSFSVGEDY